MTLALRKAACRTYAMRALNWLLRSVSQPACLHDLVIIFTFSKDGQDHQTSYYFSYGVLSLLLSQTQMMGQVLKLIRR